MLDSFNFLSFGNIKNGYSSENLISTRSSGQKEIFNLSKRMGGEEEKKRNEKYKSDCLWFRIGNSFQFL